MLNPEENIDAMEAAVIASLVQAGVSYADAKVQVLGGQVQAAEPEVLTDPEPEPKVIPQKSKDFSDDQVNLYNEVLAINEGVGQGEYHIELDLAEYLFDWVARRALQEAAKRNDPSFGVEKFIELMIKQERAIDPAKGGKVQGGSSGPRESYNPMTERWG